MVWEQGRAGLVEMEQSMGGIGSNKVVLYEESMDQEAIMRQRL